jgi:hypothetical protein
MVHTLKLQSASDITIIIFIIIVPHKTWVLISVVSHIVSTVQNTKSVHCVPSQNCIFFFSILGFELRASCLLDRHSNTWASSFFCVLDIFEVGPYFCCLRWPQTDILLISASQVARITSMSHLPSGEWYTS